MDAVITIIQTLGFPIACVVVLGYFIWKMYNNNRNDNNKREDEIMKKAEEIKTLIKKAKEEIREKYPDMEV